MSAVLRIWWGITRAIAALTLLVVTQARVDALEIILDDVAADRVERQRHFVRSELPLPGTPDLASLDGRLAAQGLSKGRAIYIRIFKAESELELWMQNGGGSFSRLAIYPICHWTGSIGPKLKEGDKQSPEGFYSVGVRQTRLVGRWRQAFNLGFPNRHDQLLDRSGSYILIHGGCSSTGCFAMTDAVQEEIYDLARAALASGQERFQVHIFPFRMTDANLAQHADHEWAHTWADLKPAYDSFERTHIPPRVALCGVRYKVADGLPGETGSAEARLPILRPPPGERTGGATLVADSEGNWLEPLCQLDDEARRRPNTIAATAELTTATLPTPTAAPKEPVKPPLSIAAPETSAVAEPAHRGRSLERAHPPPPKPLGSRPVRRTAAPSTAAPSNDSRVAVPVGEGFGSATFRARGREKITSQGG